MLSHNRRLLPTVSEVLSSTMVPSTRRHNSAAVTRPVLSLLSSPDECGSRSGAPPGCATRAREAAAADQRRHDRRAQPSRNAFQVSSRTQRRPTGRARRFQLPGSRAGTRTDAFPDGEPVSFPASETRAGNPLGLHEIRDLQRERFARCGRRRWLVRSGVPHRGGFRAGPSTQPPRVLRPLCASRPATHWHLPFTVPDLVRRAKAYGTMQLQFLRKHPGLLGDGSTQYGWLDRKFVDEWRERLDAQRNEIHEPKQRLRSMTTYRLRSSTSSSVTAERWLTT